MSFASFAAWPRGWYKTDMQPEEAAVRVMIADDHPMFRGGLAQEIREHPRLELISEASTGTDALRQIREFRPDVAILDLKMPGIDGADIARRLREEQSPTRVLVLSAFRASRDVYSALESGADGYILKDSDRDEICDAALALHRGEVVVPRQLQTELVSEIRARADDGRPLLSGREREVLRLTAKGLTSQKIGDELFIAPTTVKTHLHHLYEKLGVSDRAAMVAEAMRRGLLD
jgi:two-component system, NarL family, nitrate/nitrite response regulator NarL